MTTQKPNVGVVVGRFQVPLLHLGHKELLDKVSTECTKMIIILGTAYPINTREDPMDYKTRELMLREYYPEATITSIKDQRSDYLWTKELDRIIESLTNSSDNVMLYGGRDSFIQHYKGKHHTTEMEATAYYSGTELREKLWDKSINSVEFRSGIIRAAYSRFPIVLTTVDIAIFDNENQQILLGAKADDAELDLWRFPGGHVDLYDNSFMDAAKREAREEVGNMELDNWQYVTDTKINDWRYRSQVDVKIHTVLFKATHIFGAPKPGDDLFQAKWFDFNEDLLNTEKIKLVPAHIPLMKKLLNIT